MTDDDETFKRMVLHFWEDRGDPERYAGWDRERCARLMTDFLYVWEKVKRWRGLLDTIARDTKTRLY